MPPTIDSVSVQTHLSNLQGIIARMSQLSAHTKTWCLTLVAAIMVITTNLNQTATLWISIIPIVLFMIMDMQYLALERRFRDIYNDFVRDLHDNKVSDADLFHIRPWDNTTDMICHFFGSFFSFAIAPFYLIMVFIIALIESIWG